MSFWRNNKIAISIIELLLVMALFGIFLSLIGVICIDGIRAFHKSRDKLTTQQEAQLSLDRLSRELNESYEPGVKVFTSPWNGGTENWDAISFPTSRGGADASGDTTIEDGKLKWERYVIYFKEFGGTDLYRRVIQTPSGPPFPTDPLYPEALDDGNLTAFLTPSVPLVPRPVPSAPYTVGVFGSITDERRMAAEIYNISFQMYNPDLIEYNLPLIHITVQSRVKVGDGKNGPVYESTILTTSIKPTNR